ncbi:MAG: multifunctional oxoglutarate decarboxylase/oxoglutarate dehydrogenase thiamine pyrophosphate-binding subunit/dihydrolipoyllysine-residue succinyltransferase subunit [Chloroherpetonaceae bacterium]
MISSNEAFEYELYYDYLRNPDSVPPKWKEYFEQKYRNTIPPEFLTAKEEVTQQPIIGNIQPQDAQEIKKAIEFKIKDYEIAEPLISAEARVATNMEESLEVPTATSYRQIPVKALDENRRIINKHLEKLNKSKVSYTHIIAWAIVKALVRYPNMNAGFAKINGKPHRLIRKSINLGIAIDITRKDGSRMLFVPSIKNADLMTFSQFIKEYDNLVLKTRNNKLDIKDLSDTTTTITNPGTIGTSFSAPRLMKGQGLIIGVGSIDYPAEFQAVRPDLLSEFAISKVVTLSSTYDHRIVQGAESAEFLAYLNKLLIGGENFYEQIFYSFDVPFEPVHWEFDTQKQNHSIHSKDDLVEKNAHVMQLINAYRVRGHLLASVNPLGRAVYYNPELDPSYYGFTIWDLDRIFHVDDQWTNNEMSLRDVLELLRDSYCGQASIEFMHIQDLRKKNWIKQYFENTRNNYNIPNERKTKILEEIVEAETFENFLQTKFLGTKRFSLEGAETLIPMVRYLLNLAADEHLASAIIGMSHRGRLNVLANILGKPIKKIFREFDGDFDDETYEGSGDVKYHLGYVGKFQSEKNIILDFHLASNPSHLELVDPVIEGIAHAWDNKLKDRYHTQSLPIMIHGDSSFAGEGVVMETLNLSELEGYKTGGTIHIIVNNQIGFTTNTEDARSSYYASDIAKMIQAPILHVNASNPEAVYWSALFAFQYRQTFHSDIVIDMLCWRKYGHNEADEPSYTQPLLYKRIRSMAPISKTYSEQLIDHKIINQDFYDKIHKDILERLNNELDEHKQQIKPFEFKGFIKSNNENILLNPVKTQVPEDVLQNISEKITIYPDHFNINPKVKTVLERRHKMVFEEPNAIDWAMAEALAFGTILLDKHEIRFTGQDTRRGTFSQRHSVLVDNKNEDLYVPLNHIDEDQAIIRIFDSPLSELAVVGFEYGYSLIEDQGLTLWEAQYGDFANNALPIVDQFLACGETKWGQTSNLVMLLPHGYEGQGSEHSSARPERYLQLCADGNLIVANLSTPAQYFHILRRQVYSAKKVPLIIFTPKSLLRNPLAVSDLKEFSENSLQTIIDDKSVQNPEKIERLIFCTGKIFYELLEQKEKMNIDNIAIIRIEQLYPLDKHLIAQLLSKYSNASEYVWMQEETQNMGYWNFIYLQFQDILSNSKKLQYIGRPASPSTATGSSKAHLAEQQLIISQALKLNK